MKMPEFSFARKTTSTQFIPEIDGLRFFAIVTVVIFHLTTALAEQWTNAEFQMSTSDSWFDWTYIRLDLGVKVFFSISGMVLALPFWSQIIDNRFDISIKDYFIRRLKRLEPPYLISLTLFFIGQVAAGLLIFSEGIKSYLAGLVYGHTLFFSEGNPINPVSWSLETEAQFYILVPFIFYILYKLRKYKFWQWVMISILFIATLIFKHVLAYDAGRFYATIFYFGTHFLTGFIFAFFYLKNKNKAKKILFDFLGILALIGLFFFYKPQVIWYNNLLFNTSVFLFFWSAFNGVFVNWFFTRKWIYQIGGMCYSIYLVHYGLIFVLAKKTATIHFGSGFYQNWFLQMSILLPIVFVSSSIFYILFERPFMSSKK